MRRLGLALLRSTHTAHTPPRSLLPPRAHTPTSCCPSPPHPLAPPAAPAQRLYCLTQPAILQNHQASTRTARHSPHNHSPAHPPRASTSTHPPSPWVPPLHPTPPPSAAPITLLSPAICSTSPGLPGRSPSGWSVSAAGRAPNLYGNFTPQFLYEEVWQVSEHDDPTCGLVHRTRVPCLACTGRAMGNSGGDAWIDLMETSTR